ncbi:hypothetical protein Tco_0287529 [Tanacetum coccineum]
MKHGGNPHMVFDVQRGMTMKLKTNHSEALLTVGASSARYKLSVVFALRRGRTPASSVKLAPHTDVLVSLRMAATSSLTKYEIGIRALSYRELGCISSQKLSKDNRRSKLEYKFQDKENSEDIFSFRSALEDFICVVLVMLGTLIMSTPDYIYPIIVPSDSNVKDVFSSTNSPDYTPASPDYSSASLGNTSFESSVDLSKDLLASLAISPFHDDPYMKVMEAYNATSNESPIPPPQAPIAPPTVLPPSPMLPLSPMFDP